MAESGAFDRNIGELEKDLTAMRQAQAVVVDFLEKAAETLSAPDPAVVVVEAGRLASETAMRGQTEAGLAGLVLDLANDIAVEKTRFDDREVPTRFEAWLGRVSKSAARRRMAERGRDRMPLQRLLELLRRADRLVGLLSDERGLLRQRRDKGEADLVTFLAGRDEAVAKLSAAAEPPSTEEEANRNVADFAALGQAFVAELNDRLDACNILAHKLAADTEDLLLLYRILFDILRRRGETLPEPDRFPHLSTEMRRLAQGMLTLRGLEERRDRADQDFARCFADSLPQSRPAAARAS